jgi:hypothetical protein
MSEVGQQDKKNYAADIENIKKEGIINKQIEQWIEEGVKKGKGELSHQVSKSFWNGFLVGLLIAISIMLLWRL